MSEGRRGEIVAFERPASYWLNKARAIRAPERLPDAARMFRKALEKSGDAAVALELAHTYMDMQCFAAAERTLLSAVNKIGPTAAACLLIGRNALGMGDETLAERALEACMRLSPGSPEADSAQDILWAQPWSEESTPHDMARIDVMVRQAAIARNANDAARKMRRAAHAANSPEKALYLMQQALTRQFPRDVVKRLPREKLNFFALLQLRLQTLIGSGHKLLAAETMSALVSAIDSAASAQAYCHVALACDLPRVAVALCDSLLTQAPHSADYMRLMARCRAAQGEKDTEEWLTDRARALDRMHDERAIDSRAALISILGGIWRAKKPSELTRLLHFLSMSLGDELTSDILYAVVPPVWRALNARGRRVGDHEGWYAAFAAYALIAGGKRARARQIIESSDGRRRVKRQVKRLVKLAPPLREIGNRRTEHEMH